MAISRRQLSIAAIASLIGLRYKTAAAANAVGLLAGTRSCDSRIIPYQTSAYELVHPRLPADPPATQDLPESCRAAFESLKRQWMAEDMAQIDYLTNVFCSCRAGWTEYVPGTCKAGGPPPICPANHWYRDPDSLSKWSKENDAVREERSKVWNNALCGCMCDYLQKEAARLPAFPPQHEPAHIARGLPTTLSPSSSQNALSACRVTADCALSAPGSICSPAGSCQFPSTVVADQLKDVASDHLIEYALKGIEAFAPEMAAALHIIKSAADGSTPISTNVGAWRDSVNELSGLRGYAGILLADYKKDVTLAERGHTPMHGELYYARSLREFQHQIQVRLERAKDHLQGAGIEGELEWATCPGVVNFVNGFMDAQTQPILTLSLDDIASSGHLPGKGLKD
jgi:hypothetical protein